MLLSTNKHRRPGATAAGIFSVALSSVLLLCGAGLTPTGNVQRSDINANGYSLTNAATLQAAAVYAGTLVATNGFTPPTGYVMPMAWELKSAAFTAVAGHRYQVDTTGGAVTVTLPASASAMDAIDFGDAKLSWSTNNVIINRNGLNLNGGTANYTASVPGNKLSVVYISSGYGWSIK